MSAKKSGEFRPLFKDVDVLVSVIVPFFDEVNFLERAVNSIFANAVQGIDVEILICNDGPFREEEIETALPSNARSRTKILSNFYASGPGGARNTGLDSATGDVIAFLDADDCWKRNKLTRQLELLREGASFVVTSYSFDVGGVVVNPPKSIDSSLDVFTKRGIGTSTVVVTRELIGGTRFSDLRFSQDIDYWYRLSQKKSFSFKSEPSVLVEYHSGGSTKNKMVQLAYTYRVLRRNNISSLDRIRVLSSYIYNGIINHYLKKLGKIKARGD